MPINREEFDNLVTSVNRIERAICGDEQMGVEGLAGRLTRIEKWKTKISLRLAFLTGAAVTIWELGKAGVEYFNNKK
jgi:hypothetical protein